MVLSFGFQPSHKHFLVMLEDIVELLAVGRWLNFS
jgi:hypothetical protein